ncbi:hypothetical protein [Tautonia rosea]|uniref:hypothetical protein n=1 Tax=Tautonia rosea TaxID=2728037 RepID=UPI001472977C|nr:hypothetical protein [Tautonia rosea]
MIATMTRVLLGVCLLVPIAKGQEKPSETVAELRETGEDQGESQELAEGLALMEAMLRVREARIAEADRQLAFDRDIVEALRERREAGGVPARMVEEAEARLIGAEALVEVRQADRDELVVRLEQVKRFAASPSPEPDMEEQRARLNDEVRIREAQLRAREARVRAAEAQVLAEEQKRDQFRESVQRGTEGPGRIRQASHRVAEATAWLETMIAEREVTRLVVDRAKQRLQQFDDPEASDPLVDRSGTEDLSARVNALESLVEILRDELYQVHWELQAIRNRMP